MAEDPLNDVCDGLSWTRLWRFVGMALKGWPMADDEDTGSPTPTAAAAVVVVVIVVAPQIGRARFTRSLCKIKKYIYM